MTATFVFVLRVGLALVLYFFLWQVLQTLWQDLKRQGNALSQQQQPGIHFDIKTDDGRDNKYHFWQTEVVIGRGSHCNITLKDESLSVSHARVSFHHGQWWLEDLDSTNGTFLNNNPITTPTVVIGGDQFKCGNTTFTLRIDAHNNQLPKHRDNKNGDNE
jgi:pSer/pThr/pTyr-binding forkhead associated (FHA) protein